MAAFLVRRLCQGMLVLLVVALTGFILAQYLGDPVSNLAGQDTSPAQRAALRAELGLDASVPERFGRFLTALAQGDLGISWRQRRPVAELLAERLPATVELVLAAMLASLALGVPLGVCAALRREGLASRLVMAVSLLGVSLPTFVIGLAAIQIFSVQFGLLPSFGRGATVALGWWSTGLLTPSGRAAVVLPAATLALHQLALLIRIVRSEMLEILATAHVRFARAQGLPERTVHWRYALRCASLPVVTIAGVQLGSLIAFSTVTETVFQWPGLGALFIQAVRFADLPVLVAYLVGVGALFVTTSLLVDLLQLLLDPRLRRPGAA